VCPQRRACAAALCRLGLIPQLGVILSTSTEGACVLLRAAVFPQLTRTQNQSTGMPHSTATRPAAWPPSPQGQTKSQVRSGSPVNLRSVTSRWRVLSSCTSTWLDLVNLLEPCREEQAASSQKPPQIQYSTVQSDRREPPASCCHPPLLPPPVLPRSTSQVQDGLPVGG